MSSLLVAVMMVNIVVVPISLGFLIYQLLKLNTLRDRYGRRLKLGSQVVYWLDHAVKDKEGQRVKSKLFTVIEVMPYTSNLVIAYKGKVLYVSSSLVYKP